MLRATLRKIALPLSAFALLAFVVFLVNQTAQVVDLSGRVHPVLGTIVFWGLLALYAVCLLVPLLLFFRLPEPLSPPESEDAPEFPAHLAALRKRLRTNPALGNVPLETRGEIEAALKRLDRKADEVIRNVASQIFLTTAISQNGSLDTFLVLAAETRLIWRVARVYSQRPTLRDLFHLYANVAATAFIAGELEDIDVAAQLQPVMASVLGSAVSAVPGFQAASSLLLNSAVIGAANAFLTLRVGLIARTYSSAVVLPDRRLIRRSAMAAAAAMLGTIAVEGTRRISSAFWKASRRSAGSAVSGIGEGVKSVGTFLAEKTRLTRRPPEQPQEG